MKHRPSKRGVSLFEMSLVLVIVGLLAGAIFVGKTVIGHAGLQDIMDTYAHFNGALGQFRQQYQQLPGDLPTATSYWGWQNIAPCAKQSSAETNASKGVCDGNGDGIINAPAAASQTGESFQFWRQLASGGFIEGNYSGIAGTASKYDAMVGDSVPAARIENVGWSVYYNETGNGMLGTVASAPNGFREPYVMAGNHYRVGLKNNGNLTAGNFLDPAQAQQIDEKYDDGKPLSGKVLARFIYGATAPEPACTLAPFSAASPSGTIGQGNEAYDAGYNVQDDRKSCGLIVLIQ